MRTASAISSPISTATVRRGWNRTLTYSGRMTSNLKDMSDRDFNCMMVKSVLVLGWHEIWGSEWDLNVIWGMFLPYYLPCLVFHLFIYCPVSAPLKSKFPKMFTLQSSVFIQFLENHNYSIHSFERNGWIKSFPIFGCKDSLEIIIQTMYPNTQFDLNHKPKLTLSWPMNTPWKVVSTYPLVTYYHL